MVRVGDNMQLWPIVKSELATFVRRVFVDPVGMGFRGRLGVVCYGGMVRLGMVRNGDDSGRTKHETVDCGEV